MILETVQQSVVQSSSSGKLWRRAGLAVMVVALISIAVTFFILMGLTSIDPTRDVIMTAMAINGALAAVLLSVVSVEILKLWQARRPWPGCSTSPRACGRALQSGCGSNLPS